MLGRITPTLHHSETRIVSVLILEQIVSQDT